MRVGVGGAKEQERFRLGLGRWAEPQRAPLVGGLCCGIILYQFYTEKGRGVKSVTITVVTATGIGLRTIAKTALLISRLLVPTLGPDSCARTWFDFSGALGSLNSFDSFDSFGAFGLFGLFGLSALFTWVASLTAAQVVLPGSGTVDVSSVLVKTSCPQRVMSRVRISGIGSIPETDFSEVEQALNESPKKTNSPR